MFSIYDLIISLREVWAHKASLTLPLFIEVSVPSQDREWPCIFVLGISILPLSTILELWYFIVWLFMLCLVQNVYLLNVILWSR